MPAELQTTSAFDGFKFRLDVTVLITSQRSLNVEYVIKVLIKLTVKFIILFNTAITYTQLCLGVRLYRLRT
jgi:hypothetical protein